MEFTHKYCCHQSIKRHRNDSTHEGFCISVNPIIFVYKAITLPHFDYCSLVWDIGNTYSLEKIQKMQNRAARVITGKSYDVRSKDILQELSWQPLMDRWGNNKAIFMHKVANGEYLENISNLFAVKNNDNYNQYAIMVSIIIL